MPLFYFSFVSMSSWQLIYFNFLFTLFTAAFTALPILVLARDDQDVSAMTLMYTPQGNAL